MKRYCGAYSTIGMLDGLYIGILFMGALALLLTIAGIPHSIELWTVVMCIISISTITIGAELGHKKDLKEKDIKQLDN